MMEDIFGQMKSKWKSAVVARTEVEDFTGGLVSAKFIANHDSAGTGPANRFKIGRNVGYNVDDLCAWLESRLTQKPEVQA